MFVAKSVVDTLAIDSHVFYQVLDGRPLVTARPENLHRSMQGFLAIELFLPWHRPFRDTSYTLSGTTSQECWGRGDFQDGEPQPVNRPIESGSQGL